MASGRSTAATLPVALPPTASAAPFASLNTPPGFDDARDVIGLADEVGDEERRWRIVDFTRRARLGDAAGMHDTDEIAHGERLLLVVGDEQKGDAKLALQGLQLELHRGSQLAVERRQRLVEQQHRGPVDDGAGKRHALLLAAGEFMNASFRVAAKAHEFQRFLRPAQNLAPERSRGRIWRSP